MWLEERQNVFWLLIYGNSIAEIGEKKLLQLVYGNDTAKIKGKKNCRNEFVAMTLPK